ncbi:hypothetical protein AAF712_011086 [Marasmius tenuissimus]|uniref:BTB domain-containing protein n=1 Tax=Marasmius tenuissimus TaxID=585030 RepID=A0ABR2ZM42_9AGAR|nr:hypothetical protein PM082_024638 [Marasmius tenuissimus]
MAQSSGTPNGPNSEASHVTALVNPSGSDEVAAGFNPFAAIFRQQPQSIDTRSSDAFSVAANTHESTKKDLTSKKRGRPKGSKNRKTLQRESSVLHDNHVVKKRGRPRGSKNKRTIESDFIAKLRTGYPSTSTDSGGFGLSATMGTQIGGERDEGKGTVCSTTRGSMGCPDSEGSERIESGAPYESMLVADTSQFPHKCTVARNARCSLPVDLIIKSSDGEYIGAHTQNLILTRELPGVQTGFVGRRRARKMAILPETAAIIRILLSFSHDNEIETPDIAAMSIDELTSLTEAAKRYDNQSALAACTKILGIAAKRSPQDAIKVLVSKVSASDSQGIDEVARQTVSVPIKVAMDCFGQHCDGFRIWLRYQQTWLEATEKYQAAVAQHRTFLTHTGWFGGNSECPCLRTVVDLLGRVSDIMGLWSVEDFEKALEIVHCDPGLGNCSCNALESWKAVVCQALAGMPCWSQFS